MAYPSWHKQIPTSYEALPDPTIPQSGKFVCPCPYCLPGNCFGWQCPNPVPNPMTDLEHAWPIDKGSPLGHGCCENQSAYSPFPLCFVCVNLLDLYLASQQKFTCSQCTHDNMCQVSFCRIGMQHCCIAICLALAHLHGMSDISNLIQSTKVYECFDRNTVKVEIMLNYLGNQHILPWHYMAK